MLGQQLPSGTVAVVASVVGAVLLYVGYGVWDKNMRPKVLQVVTEWWAGTVLSRKTEIEQTIDSHEGQHGQTLKRKSEIQEVVSGWHNAPEQVLSRGNFTRNIIDAEVMRTDGVIHRAVREGVAAAVQPLHSDVSEIKTLIQQSTFDNGSFRQEVISRLSHMEGVLSSKDGQPHNRGLRADGFVPLGGQVPPLPKKPSGG